MPLQPFNLSEVGKEQSQQGNIKRLKPGEEVGVGGRGGGAEGSYTTGEMFIKVTEPRPKHSKKTKIDQL